MDGTPHPDTDAPQLRTLLLTDLCDSTGLVERQGDTAAAQLFRDHDRLVLELQQRWRGRLIDRSDGLLLLFERPLDGLGFALDYRRSLEALGQAHRIDPPLMARAGLHVGEVLVWRNSEEAVNAGAKPVEVEGLAKPFAARLMQLARPGQILLSSVAEPLVRRAARELGERGETLQWRSHGRWLFKGLPEVQEVHEVGEPDLAPLRMPRGDAKARRDLPAWRRPLALAAEAVLLAGVAVGVWLMTRPEPAIAFSERDWVVLGDLRNLTGQTVLDDSLEQAFRISLEQSRYVNVLSDLKVRDTLKRMERDPDATRIDRAIGSEVAQRDGARLLILPTVAEVGGRVRFSADVVDPKTQRTLAVESADGRGLESALTSIDRVAVLLRDAVGENLASIRSDSAPLPDVTTSNLDALRSYALGQAAYGKGRYPEAAGFYARAVDLDPDFALAHIGLVRTSNAQMDLAQGAKHLAQAVDRRERLPPRDRLYLDAWSAELGDRTSALAKWRQMSELYPDYFPAYANVGYALWTGNRYAEALDYAQRAAVPQNEFAPLATALVGYLRLGTEDPVEAERAFSAAHAAGLVNARVGLALSKAAQNDFDRAHEAWRGLREPGFAYFDGASILLNQARWQEAEQEMRAQLASSGPTTLRNELGQVAVSSIEWGSGQEEAARARLPGTVRGLLERVEDPATPRPDAEDAAFAALTAALLAQRMGDGQPIEQVLRRLGHFKGLLEDSPVSKLYNAARASQLLRQGQAVQAVALLEALVDGAEPVRVHKLLLDAYRASGDRDKALAQARWLSTHRGRSYVELGCGRCHQALNVYDSVASHLDEAELLAFSNRKEEASAAIGRLDAIWPVERLPDHLRRRREAVVGTFN
jgi:putative peptide modification system cyclase